MNYKKHIQSLENILQKSNELKGKSTSNPQFIVWKNLASRALEKIFGANSVELEHFKKLNFSYNPLMWDIAGDYSSENYECYQNDLRVATEMIKSYISEFNEELSSDNSEKSSIQQYPAPNISKVFISHSSKDKDIVEELIDLLEAIGLNNSQIFCSSFAGYGIELGENFLDRIKNELDSNVLVLFILSKNFYSSEVCLCEMGATWVKTNEHLPILIPPLDFKDIKGVIPLTQGFKITDNSSLTLFRDKITRLFDLKTMNTSVWERKRDKLVKRLNEILNSQPIKAPSRFTAIAVKRK